VIIQFQVWGEFGHFDVTLRKERPPEVWQIPSETPCITCLIYLHYGRFLSYRCKFTEGTSTWSMAHSFWNTLYNLFNLFTLWAIFVVSM